MVDLQVFSPVYRDFRDKARNILIFIKIFTLYRKRQIFCDNRRYTEQMTHCSDETADNGENSPLRRRSGKVKITSRSNKVKLKQK
jgi:hypothetical protein